MASFQVGRLATHPAISFGNITIIHTQIYPQRQLIQEFKTALNFLKIQDMTVYCADIPSFMVDAIALWAPFLQDLQILRIMFDRDMDVVKFPFVPRSVKYLILYSAMF